jgi:hypothetical protein
MTDRKTVWRRALATAAVSGALLLPATPVFAQAATPTIRPVPSPTRAAVTTSPASGEPIQDATMVALVLGAMVVGGLALKQYADRRGA